MKWALRLCVVASAIVVGSGFVQVARKSDDAGWITFSSKLGGFAILMPIVPKEEVQTYNTDVGKLDGHLAIAELGDSAAFIVSYSDFPSAVTQQTAINRILDGARNNLLANKERKLLNERNITLDTYFGRDLTIDTPEGMMITRIYWVTRRLYQLIGITGKTVSPDVDKFLASFKIKSDVSLLTSASGWTEFVSEGGGFTVLMPSRPTEQVMPVPSGTASLDMHVYVSIGQEGIAFIVSYSDLQNAPKDQNELIRTLDGVRNGQLEKAKGKLLSETTLSLNGNQGRELKIDTPVGISTSRIFLVKNRLYQIIVVAPLDVVSSQSAVHDTSNFFGSFRLASR